MTATTGRAPTIHVVIGNPKPGGRTTTTGMAVAVQLQKLAGHLTVEPVELAEHTGGLFDWGDAALRELVERITTGTALVVASPTYKASYTGLLKAFFDRFAAGSLAGVVTVPVMLGGSPAHSLAVEVHLKPVLAELGATMPAGGIYVIDTEIGEIETVLDDWRTTHHPVLTPLLGG